LSITLMNLYKLDKIGILLIEGGASTLNHFIEEGLWDEAKVITNHSLRLGEGIKAPYVSGKLKKKYAYATDKISVILKE
ncbi:MAG: riboflavin biosynthesis protein RibD, partial [Saprospiraceae bacterium]